MWVSWLLPLGVICFACLCKSLAWILGDMCGLVYYWCSVDFWFGLLLGLRRADLVLDDSGIFLGFGWVDSLVWGGFSGTSDLLGAGGLI